MLNRVSFCFLSFFCFILSSSLYAETPTIAKLTRLTGKDASQFIQRFGRHYEASQQVQFHCNVGECLILITKNNLYGKTAERFLEGQEKMTYRTQDGRFSLLCREANGNPVCSFHQLTSGYSLNAAERGAKELLDLSNERTVLKQFIEAGEIEEAVDQEAEESTEAALPLPTHIKPVASSRFMRSFPFVGKSKS